MTAPVGSRPGPIAASDEHTAITFDGVGKRFDDQWVVRNLDVSVDASSIHGLIGPSGCGKTTTVRLALGYHRPDEGWVRLLGTDPVTRSNRERTQVGYLPQHPVLFDELSLRQNLAYHASLHGLRLRRTRRLDDLLELVGLAGDSGKRAGDASGGMRRRLALAGALVAAPSLLFLDEPTAGVDPILRRELWDEFERLARTGTTLVVTTQFVEEAANCDVVSVLAEGDLRASGTPTELIGLAHGGPRFELYLDRPVGGAEVTEIGRVDGVVGARATAERTVQVTLDADGDDRSGRLDDLDVALRDRVRAAAGGAEIESFSAVPTDWNDVFAALVATGAGDR